MHDMYVKKKRLVVFWLSADGVYKYSKRADW